MEVVKVWYLVMRGVGVMFLVFFSQMRDFLLFGFVVAA
jgi:hypothetical protein